MLHVYLIAEYMPINAMPLLKGNRPIFYIKCSHQWMDACIIRGRRL